MNVVSYIYNVKLPEDRYLIDKQIINSLKYDSYFGNSLDILNGTYIKVHIPYKMQIPYQNCKENTISKCICNYQQ